MQKIKDNKVEPIALPRNIAPAYAILSIGLIGLVATYPELKNLPV